MMTVDWFIINNSSGKVDLNLDSNDVDLVVSKVQVGGHWYMTVNGDRFGYDDKSIKIGDLKMIDVEADIDQDIDLSAVTFANGFTNMSGLGAEPVQINCSAEDHPNEIIGSGYADNIQGGGGDDLIVGNTGADKLYGGEGDDFVLGAWAQPGGSGWVHDGTNDDNAQDLVEGGDGWDYLAGGGGNDTLNGGDGWDVMDGGSGNDLMHGNDGVDEMYGQGGNDWLYGDEDSDLLYGADGYDTIVGGADLGGDEDYVDGGASADYINLSDGFNNDTYVIDAADFVLVDLYDLGI